MSLVPEDLPPVAEIPAGKDPTISSAWLEGMRGAAKNSMSKAVRDYNLQASNIRESTVNQGTRRILSAEGFPPGVVVSYISAPLLAYHSCDKPREITHVVLHSFGHSWHADSTGRGGWFNNPSVGGVEPYEYKGQIIYVAKGTDPKNLGQSNRFSSTIQMATGPMSRSTAHFYIDRAGNLLVVGSVNDVMFVANAVNETSVSVALEEAFYLVKDPLEEKATWSPGGVPPGTAGNVQYFAFSMEQITTLSILCKKLELAFPALTARNVNLARKSVVVGSPPGYTMHDFIQGSKVVDISPHFLTQKYWDEFFKWIDKQTHINQTNVWKSPSKYKDIGGTLASAPLSNKPINLMTERFLASSRGYGLGLCRSRLMVTSEKPGVVEEAGKSALQDSKKIAQTAANTYNLSQQITNPPVTLADDTVEDEQGGWDDTWG